MLYSYKVGVLVRDSSVVVYNGLRFITEENALQYAEYLKLRWSEIRETVVVASLEKPNSTFPVPSDRYAVDRTP